MSVFASQIFEAVDDVQAVVIHDAARRVVWASSGSDGLQSGKAHQFDLKHGSARERIGSLTVLTHPGSSGNAEFVSATVAPIVRCVERQIDINAELSSVRQVSDATRLGMKLLVELDKLDESADPEQSIRTLLRQSAGHFGATFSAALLPGFKIQVLHPQTLAGEGSPGRRGSGGEAPGF